MLLWLLLACNTGFASATLTTISDVVYRADGSFAKGTVVITWPAFTTSDNRAIAAGSLSIAIGTSGQLTVALVPNAGSTPSGTYYKVVYKLDDGSTSEEYWSVPAATTTTISAIRSRIVPTSIAVNLRGVTSFNGRTGAVLPLASDYSFDQLGGIPATFPPSTHTHSADQVSSGVLDSARVISGTISKGRCLHTDPDTGVISETPDDCGSGSGYSSTATFKNLNLIRMASQFPNTGSPTTSTNGVRVDNALADIGANPGVVIIGPGLVGETSWNCLGPWADQQTVIDVSGQLDSVCNTVAASDGLINPRRQGMLIATKNKNWNETVDVYPFVKTGVQILRWDQGGSQYYLNHKNGSRALSVDFINQGSYESLAQEVNIANYGRGDSFQLIGMNRDYGNHDVAGDEGVVGAKFQNMQGRSVLTAKVASRTDSGSSQILTYNSSSDSTGKDLNRGEGRYVIDATQAYTTGTAQVTTTGGPPSTFPQVTLSGGANLSALPGFPGYGATNAYCFSQAIDDNTTFGVKLVTRVRSLDDATHVTIDTTAQGQANPYPGRTNSSSTYRIYPCAAITVSGVGEPGTLTLDVGSKQFAANDDIEIPLGWYWQSTGLQIIQYPTLNPIVNNAIRVSTNGVGGTMMQVDQGSWQTYFDIQSDFCANTGYNGSAGVCPSGFTALFNVRKDLHSTLFNFETDPTYWSTTDSVPLFSFPGNGHPNSLNYYSDTARSGAGPAWAFIDQRNPTKAINLLPNTGEVSGMTFSSRVPTGTKPFNVTSTTLNDNLNADMVDGKHASDFGRRSLVCYIGTANGSALADSDDQPNTYRSPEAWHITAVHCKSDAGAPRIQVAQGGNNVLADNSNAGLDCSASGTSSTSFQSSRDAVTSGAWIDCNIVAAGGVARQVTIQIDGTVD